MLLWFFVFKQKTAYEMRISDWSSDVCSSDLLGFEEPASERVARLERIDRRWPRPISGDAAENPGLRRSPRLILRTRAQPKAVRRNGGLVARPPRSHQVSPTRVLRPVASLCIGSGQPPTGRGVRASLSTSIRHIACGLVIRYRHPSRDGSCAVRKAHSSPACCIRSEEHTSELQSPMRISYAVFCLTK